MKLLEKTCSFMHVQAKDLISNGAGTSEAKYNSFISFIKIKAMLRFLLISPFVEFIIATRATHDITDSQVNPTGATKAVVCVILSVG